MLRYPPLARNEIVGRVRVDVVAVRALEFTGGLMWGKLAGALAGGRLAPFHGEALRARFAFHQPC